MPKEIVVTGLGNKIEYATTNGKGLITGKREDITDQCINAVYAHLKTEFDRSKKSKEKFGYKFSDGGKLMYIHPTEEGL
jgi:hypothetical protein